MPFGARWLLGTCGVLLVAAYAPSAEACTPKMAPARWEKVLAGGRRLVFINRTGAGDRNAEPQLKLYEGTVLRWSQPWDNFGPRSLSGEPFELSPNGKLLVAWGLEDVRVMSARDGKIAAVVHPAEQLSEAERLGGGPRRSERNAMWSPCAEGSGESWSMKRGWKKSGELSLKVTTAPQQNGARREVEMEIDGAGKLTRITSQEQLDLRAIRADYLEAGSIDERRKALTALVWSSTSTASLNDQETDDFFLRVARDRSAPADFLLLAVNGLRSRREARKQLYELTGRDPEVDALLLHDAAEWTPDQQRAALKNILTATGRAPEQQRGAFALLSANYLDLRELAMLGVRSTDPGLRAAVLTRINAVPPQEEHLSAALACLADPVPAVLELARKAAILNLSRAAPKVHTDEILKALAANQIKPWPEGDLSLGIYLQASGQLALAGGLFASGVERTDDQPTTLRNELLSRLAINMILRSKPVEARAAIVQLQKSGGPLGGPLICALTVPEARVGVLPPCGRKLPTKTQADALMRALSPAVP
jgi:hypothetical protein